MSKKSFKFWKVNWKIRINKIRMKHALFYKKENSVIRCQLCPHNCLIPNSKTGICRVRKNIDNKLYSLFYGKPCCVHIDPLTKKPIYHMLPGTTSYSIGMPSCNLKCLFCQNWEISQYTDMPKIDLPPKKAVEEAKKSMCKSISYTYTEPLINFEYVYETAKIAKQNKLKNVIISNGFINEKPLRKLCRYIDAANIDLKFFDDNLYKKICKGSLAPILNTLKVLKEENVWLEITNLIIPTLNDKEEKIKEMCSWILKNLGQVPLHFSRYYPVYKLQKDITPIETLEKARKIALAIGLKYVYIGNIPDHTAQNTYCEKCGTLLIDRQSYQIKDYTKKGICPKCHTKLPGVF